MQAHVEGKPALPVQVANAARSAVVAVDLAVAGLKGPQQSIDGPFGYLPLFESDYDLVPVLRDLSAVRRITEVSWKAFPTGRAAQGGLVAVAELMRLHGVSRDQLQTLTFTAPPLIKRLVGRPAVAGMDVAYARLCLPWLAAVTLTLGEVGLGDFTPERLGDPELLALGQCISVIDDGGRDPAAFTPLIAAAHLKDGRTVKVEIKAMLGAPSNPLTRAQHMDKARRCLGRAGLEQAHQPLAEVFAALETSDDVASALAIEPPERRTPAVN
jgi:2-methylcitrate dehydratase PrpD